MLQVLITFYTLYKCHDPSFELMTKAKAWKVQVESHINIPKSVGKCEGMNPHTPKWIPTLKVRVSMES